MVNDRIKILIDHFELNKNSFSKKIGLENNVTIGNIVSGRKTKPSYDIILKIAETFPTINLDWLITGNGEMISDEYNNSEVEIINTDEIQLSPSRKINKQKSKGLVPYYDVDFAAGNELILVENDKVKPDYYMDIPEFTGCTAFRAYSDSMEKLIKSGSILFGTKVDEWKSHLEYGQIYGIICTDGRRYLKYIRREKANPENYFLLQSENEMYDDFEMPKLAIRSIWLIHGWLNKRT